MSEINSFSDYTNKYNSNVDYSALFGGTSNSSSLGGTNILSDYASIKNGSYGKLLKAFHVDQVSIRLVKDAPLLGDEPLNSPEKVVEKLAGMMSEFDREVVGVINFRSDMTPINIHFASMGSDANISMMVTDMKNGEVQYLADYLMNAIRDEDGIVSEQIEAQKLLKELKEMVCDIEVNEELITPPAESVQEQTIYHSEDVIESYRAKTMEAFHELDGENAESIEKMVKAKAQDIMDTMGIDAQIVDAVLIGSRSRGIRQEDGNVELVVDIKGEVPKEEIAGILNGENIEIAGQKVVMETIVNDQPMPLADFLQHTESSLMAQQKQEVEEATTKEEREETKRAVKETGKYANFKMVKGNQDQRYYLFADVKYPSGEIVKERPIAEFPNKKVCEQFCMKNRIRAEDLTGSLKKKIEHKLQLRVDTESNKKEQSKSRSGSIEDD